MVGFSHMVFAERLRRARCWSRSGVRPSKARAPSNTLEPSQKACVRGPTIALLPSNHSPSRKVWVRDQSAMGRARDLDAKKARGIRHRPASRLDKGESYGFLVRVDGDIAGGRGPFRGAERALLVFVGATRKFLSHGAHESSSAPRGKRGTVCAKASGDAAAAERHTAAQGAVVRSARPTKNTKFLP